MMVYDDQNVFAKILRGKFPAQKLMKMNIVYVLPTQARRHQFMFWLYQKGHMLIGMTLSSRRALKNSSLLPGPFGGSLKKRVF